MKKIISIFLCISFLICLAGCKSNKKVLDYNLDEYITVAPYDTLTLDTKGDDYKLGLSYSNYENLTNAEIEIESEEVKSGEVLPLDTVNIDYVGKKTA